MVPQLREALCGAFLNVGLRTRSRCTVAVVNILLSALATKGLLIIVIHLVLSTRNAHKIAEFRALLPGEFRLWSLDDIPDAPAVIEDRQTFAGNATKKAVELARWISCTPSARSKVLGGASSTSSILVLADDSGLEVDALNGQPGVNSARFAAADLNLSGNAPDGANNAKLLRLLETVPAEKRTARFRCVIAIAPVVVPTVEMQSPVCSSDEIELQTELFEGTCEGRIAFELRGVGGFGYDPLFVPDGFDQSFAELGDETKNRISHRAQAARKLQGRLAGR